MRNVTNNQLMFFSFSPCVGGKAVARLFSSGQSTLMVHDVEGQTSRVHGNPFSSSQYPTSFQYSKSELLSLQSVQ